MRSSAILQPGRIMAEIDILLTRTFICIACLNLPFFNNKCVKRVMESMREVFFLKLFYSDGFLKISLLGSLMESMRVGLGAGSSA